MQLQLPCSTNMASMHIWLPFCTPLKSIPTVHAAQRDAGPIAATIICSGAREGRRSPVSMSLGEQHPSHGQARPAASEPLGLLNYTVNLEKRQKSPLEKIQKTSGDGTPKSQISVPCRGRKCPELFCRECVVRGAHCRKQQGIAGRPRVLSQAKICSPVSDSHF